jgi:putative transposase
MARIARVVAAGLPHHITQRGNRRQETFFSEEDYREYLGLMAEWTKICDVDVWAYCLMPNHVHMILVPQSPDGFYKALGEMHRRYTRMINFRHGWRGHLWQGRFSSFVMDEKHLLAASRYIEMNPVRAHLVKTPWDYPWSSAKAHLHGMDDSVVNVRPLLEMVGDWKTFIESAIDENEYTTLRRHEKTGRPLGDVPFVKSLELALGRILSKQKPGPKPHDN